MYDSCHKKPYTPKQHEPTGPPNGSTVLSVRYELSHCIERKLILVFNELTCLYNEGENETIAHLGNALQGVPREALQSVEVVSPGTEEAKRETTYLIGLESQDDRTPPIKFRIILLEQFRNM